MVVLDLRALLFLAAVRPFTVAVDAGHGGTNLGAAGLDKGVFEKHITLDVARRLQARLAEDGRVRVILCRETDALVPVRARVRCANEADAQLFLSIHANASPLGDRRGSQRGFEIYVLPVALVDQEAALAAVKADDVVEAVWESERLRADATESLAAARRIELDLADAYGVGADRGIKQEGAALDVLQGLTMPGVLVEIGFVDHPEEGRRLATAEGRDQVAAALARTVAALAARADRARTDPSITAEPVLSPGAAPRDGRPRGSRSGGRPNADAKKNP